MGKEVTDEAGTLPAVWSHPIIIYVLLTTSKAWNSEGKCEYTIGDNTTGEIQENKHEKKNNHLTKACSYWLAAPSNLFNDCTFTTSEWLYQVSQFFHNTTPE